MMNQSATSGSQIKVLFDEETIARRVQELASEIAAAELENLLVVAILKGSFIFTADLLRAMYTAGMAPEVEFTSLSSYRDATISSGHVSVVRDIESNVADRSVLLIDDILESGRTLAFAKDLMIARKALQVKTCVLLDKPKHRITDIEADFIGFECPDQFVVGYGMDMAHAYRELPFVGVVEV
jgi:hypoxanthine phosphoribosyltransferase